MNILILIASLLIILAGCEGFTNGVEWFGRKRGLGVGAVGSILAAVGTALPETLIPIVAIVFATGDHAEAIGIGAIVGAPFMLATLAMFMVGFSLVLFRFTNGRPLNPTINVRIISRDLLFFITFYSAVMLAGVLHNRVFNVILAITLWLGYGIYVYVILRTEGDLDGHTRPLYLASGHVPHHPRLRWVLLQILISLGAIVFGAHLFVGVIDTISASLGLSALVISMLIAPVATELPEKFNSALWIRTRKDTLAFGNITGAMVFQSTFPVSVGLILTDWELARVSVVSGIFALGSGGLLVLWILFKRTISWWMLLFSGAWYAAFVFYALKYAL